MAERKPAEVFPPGEFIREELEERNWTQGDLAEIMGRPIELINRIVSAKRAITPETAKGLGDAFGTGAQLWLNLESTYRLSLVDDNGDDVSRKARLYDRAPIKDMVKRQWIEPTNDVGELENEIIRFFELESINDTPQLAVAARKSTDYQDTAPAQLAWFYRAKHLARMIDADQFRKARYVKMLGDLKNLARDPEEVRKVPRMLADAGVRFLVVEHLPKSRIDGAAFWLDSRSPVIVLSLRFDRLDWFWHTLGHELGHVFHRDNLSLDTELVGGRSGGAERPDIEIRADRFASELLVSNDEFDDFIVRVKPLYSKQKIRGFAMRMGVHPAIVVGRLQHREEINYAHSREMLVKIRDIITSSALTDGWGSTVVN